MSNAQNLTASQRAANFAQATRQNMQMLASQSTNVGATSLQFNLPKARLLASILVNVELKVNATGTGSIPYRVEDIHNIIRRWSLDLNNGFSPFVIGGKELYFLNLLRGNKGLAEMMYDGKSYADIRSHTLSITADTTGHENTIKFAVELPVTLNDRDSVGLILLQNEQTNVQLVADIGNIGDCIHDDDIDVEMVSLKLTPMITTYSIPASAEAFPDLSVLKLVNSRQDSFVGAGQHIIKLSTGTIYRRMLFRLTDENGNAFDTKDINGDIQLVFNQADVPYSINAETLRTLNRMWLGYELPFGLFMFDFSYQGIANMGGTRDYIDSANVSEFWIRFNSTKGGKFELVTETLARLQ